MALSLIVADRNLTEIAEGLSWSSVDPGGHEALSFTMPGTESLPVVGDRVRLYEGLECIFDGRVDEPGQDYDGPRASGRITAVGAGAALRDTQYSMVYVDRDMSRWTNPPTPRQKRLDSINTDIEASPLVAPATNTYEPSIETTIHGAWTRSNRCEAWYDAGLGNTIDSIYYEWDRGGQVNNADANWSWAVTNIATDDANPANGEVTSGSLRAAGPGSGTLSSCLYRWCRVYLAYAAAAGSAGVKYTVWWHELAVFGPSGLSKRGSTPSEGFYTSDIVGHALAQATGIDAGPLEENTSYVVQQASYRDLVYPEQVIDEMAKLEGYHWGVWGQNDPLSNPLLHFVAPPTEPTAIVGRTNCERIQFTERLSDHIDTLNVHYRDPSGESRYTTVTRGNPRLPTALVGREATVDAGTLATSSEADTFGEMLLALREQQARAAGFVTLPEIIKTTGGVSKPAHLLKAGLDRLRITDLPNAGTWTEGDTRRFDTFRIRRVESSVGEGGRVTTRVELDAGADLIEVLQARMALATGILGL